MTTLSVSQRGRNTPTSPIRKLAPYADAAKAKGVHIFHLNIGQPDIPTPREFYVALEAFKERVLAYGPSNGFPFFRQSLEKYYRRCGYSQIEQQDIMVTTAGSEAVLFSIMAVASPGDEIIAFEPFYPNYNGFAQMAGVTLVPVSTDPESGYHLPNRDLIETKISKKTKAILINSPNNPTGTILRRDELDTIKTLAVKHNLFILSDEVYREFVFEGTHTSVLVFPEIAQHAVLMDSLSKRYSACGSRIGCIVSKNSEIMETVLKFGQARLCPPTLEQVGAAALVDEGDKYFKEMLTEYNKRRDTVYEKLMRIPGVHCKRPEGAFYLMVTFPVEDIEDFARWLLTDFQVDGGTTMMAPGPGFYATPGKGRQEARIAYVLNTDDLKKAVHVLDKGLSVYKTK
ncbi:MAG: pyridoxal phosphate-dependent aminotransferase [bacterium]